MKIYSIPGREDLVVENLILDYNGTIARDGFLIEGVKEVLNSIKDINIYIVTADTYGSVEKECRGIASKIIRFPKENAGEEKLRILEELGENKTICIGNGYNDIAMCKASVLSIGIMGEEGISAGLLQVVDLVVKDIVDGLELILHKNRLKAGLRN